MKYKAVVTMEFDIEAENICEARRATKKIRPLIFDSVWSRNPGPHDRDFIRSSLRMTSKHIKVAKA